MAANKSGKRLKANDIPIILGMVARGDRHHDIAAWFGVNQGRIAEAIDGKFGTPAMADSSQLPPKGPPGIKGQILRSRVDSLIVLIDAGDYAGAVKALRSAAAEYDKNET